MSFGDFNSGKNEKYQLEIKSNGNQDSKQIEMTKLSESIRGDIFAISGNISSIQRFTSLLGTPKDSLEIRNKLNGVQAQTQDLVKLITGNLKSLNSQYQKSSVSSSNDRLKQLEYQKLTRDFKVVLDRFQQIQRLSAEKSREFILKHAHHDNPLDTSNYSTNDNGGGDGDDGLDVPLLANQHLQLKAEEKLEGDLKFNELIINEREVSIREVEQSIHQVNEIFRDLGSLVADQQGMLDNIESNIESSVTRTGEATFELGSANSYSRKSQNKLCYILAIILAILVVLIVIFVLTKR